MIRKPELDVVALAAIINAGPARLAEIEQAAAKVTSWQPLIASAERDGLAPILYRHLRTSGFDRSPEAMSALRALSIRHRHATSIRITEFHHMSQALTGAGVPSAALKGVALAGLIYPEPGLRPMRDIDFLVAPGHAQTARRVLEDIGYRFDSRHLSRYMRFHHHLPNASKRVDGLMVSAEIHTRALSGDSPGRVTMSSLVEPLQSVKTADGEYKTLGHIDMLNQLCRHALEPGQKIRLVSLMDIQGYCEHFDAEIDWAALDGRYPYIANFLRLSDAVAPLPESLSRFAYRGPPIEDPGRLIPTVSTTFSRHRGSPVKAIRELLDPPGWWFRSYYAVGDDGRGERQARMLHAARLSAWLWRRAVARAVSPWLPAP